MSCWLFRWTGSKLVVLFVTYKSFPGASEVRQFHHIDSLATSVQVEHRTQGRYDCRSGKPSGTSLSARWPAKVQSAQSLGRILTQILAPSLPKLTQF